MTTQSLTNEIGTMRKLIEDMHISASEKDAEIIKLRMHLGDEKARSRMRQTSQASLLNHSKELGSPYKPTRPQEANNETPKHRRGKSKVSSSYAEKDISELQRSHQQDIAHLHDKMKE